MKKGFILLTASVLSLGSLTAFGQAPAAPPASSGDAQVRTKQVQVKQRKFDYYIKDGTNQLNFAKSRFLAGRKDLCENNLILSQLRVDVTLSIMRDHPNELANLSGFFVLKSTREGYFKSYTEYQRQVLALQDEIRLFAERNGPFAAFNYYKANLQQGVLTGGEAAAANIEAKINQAINQNTTVKPTELGGPGGVAGAGITGSGGGRLSMAAQNFFANPTDSAAVAAFVQQAIAGGLAPAVANQLATAFAAGDIRTVAQIAAQNPNSPEARQALAELLRRLGVSQGLQQLGMSSEDAQAAEAAFKTGDAAALERLKEKYKDNPLVVAAINALLEQMRSGGAGTGAGGQPVTGLPTTLPGSSVPVTSPPPLNPPSTPPVASLPPGGVPRKDVDRVFDKDGNLLDIWSGGADPSEGTRATYADEKGGRISAEMRMTRQFVPRPGGGYIMQEAPDAASKVDWSLDIQAKGEGDSATFEVSDAVNAAAKFEVTAWYDAKGQRIASTSRQFTTAVPKGKFTIMVEGRTKTFKNPSPFRIKIEGGQ